MSRLEPLLTRVAKQIEGERIALALRSVRKLSRLATRPDERVAVGLLHAEALLEARRLDEAGTVLAALKASSVITSDQLTAVLLLTAHGAALSGNSRDALRLVRPIVRHAASVGELRARARWTAGLALYRSGHYKWARSSYLAAASYYRLVGRTRDLARILKNLALVEKSEGRVSRALDYLDEAALLLPRGSHSKTWFRLLVNRGICLLKVGRFLAARECFLEARNHASTTDEPLYSVMLDNNLGHTYHLEGTLGVAEEFHRAALESARTHGSVRQECLAMEFLGEVLTAQGKHADAIGVLTESVSVARSLGTRGDLLMETLRRRGEALLAIGRNPEGLADLDECIRLCRARGEVRELALAERSRAIAQRPTPDLDTVQRVLAMFEEIEDRFEYARTVVLTIESGYEEVRTGWLADSIATAIHHLNSLDCVIWKRRLLALVGHTVQRPATRVTESGPTLETRSSLFAAAIDAARLAATRGQPALVLGPTGAGKEVLARAIHDWSTRHDKPFVAINCGALPENLVESELFGHVRGTFTGGDRDRAGLLETAEGGTILLDEVADLPLYMQVKLLRFLDSGEVRRLGSNRERHVDVRVIAATNRDLEAMARDGRFRVDLYYRLNVFRVEVPSLRQRPEDIFLLAEHFLSVESNSRLPVQVSDRLRMWLDSHDWPGNVRELLNVCRYLSARAWGKAQIDVDDLPPGLRMVGLNTRVGANAYAREQSELERAQIIKALREAGGTISAAAKLMSIGRNTLARKIREYGIERESLVD